MDKSKSEKLKREALHRIDKLITGYIDNDLSNADKLSYWLRDYASYLEFEKEFDPKKNKRYKRGEIIKANLGYNIGSEEGGLHYCVIIDADNKQSSPIVTVIPLTSLKDGKADKLPRSSVYIGTEIFDSLKTKVDNGAKAARKDLNAITDEIDGGKKLEEVSEALDELAERINMLNKMQNEISKMKKGSIALVSQITTISKIRIVDPKKNADVLSGIRLKPETLDLLDDKIRQLYIKKDKKS